MSQKVTNLCVRVFNTGVFCARHIQTCLPLHSTIENVAAHSAILTYEKYAPVYLIISALTFAPF